MQRYLVKGIGYWVKSIPRYQFSVHSNTQVLIPNTPYMNKIG